MGLVAYCVADHRSRPTRSAPRARSSSGSALGLVLGHGQRLPRRGPPGAGDRRHARHAAASSAASTTCIAGSHQVPLAGLPPGFTDAARDDHPRHPDLRRRSRSSSWSSATVVLRWTRFGRQVYAVGSNPEAAAILGIPSRLVVVRRRSPCAACSPASPASCGSSSSGRSTARRRPASRSRSSPRSSSAASNIFGGIGDRRRRGARRAVPRLHRQRPHPRRAVAVLAAGDLRPRDPRRGQRRRASSCAGSSASPRAAADDARP